MRRHRRIPTIWIVIGLLIVGGGGTVLAQQYVLPLMDGTVSAQPGAELTTEPGATAEPRELPERPGVPGSAAADGTRLSTQAMRTGSGIYDVRVSNPYSRGVQCTVTIKARVSRSGMSPGGALRSPYVTYSAMERVTLGAGESQVVSLSPPTADTYRDELDCGWD
jgi:hypothetical protein